MSELPNSFYLIVSLFLFSYSSYAQPAFFDHTFGTAGITIVPASPTMVGSFEAMQVLPDGNIIVAGKIDDNAMVGRFKPNGTPDSSFASNGFYSVPVPAYITNCFYDVVVQPDGKIVAAGSADTAAAGSDILVVRLSSMGIPDATFGLGGILLMDPSGVNDQIRSVALQADDKIILTGSLFSSQSGAIRLKPNGIIDTSFGVNGIVIFGNDPAYFSDIAPDGKIVAAGNTTASAGYLITAQRYLADGTPDTSFNHTGVVYTQAGDAGHNKGYAVKVQPDGKILVAGNGQFGSLNDNFVVVRYKVNGTLDSSFGNMGIADVDISSSEDYTSAMKLLPDGRILLTGSSDGSFDGSSDARKVATVMLNSDGTPDLLFGIDGIIINSLRGILDGGKAVTVQADGKVLVAGVSARSSGGIEPAIIRYLPQSTGTHTLKEDRYIGVAFPDPVNDLLHFQFPYSAETVILLTDITGRIVNAQTVKNNTQATVHVQGYAPGVYTYHIVSGNNKYDGKVLVTE